MRKFILLLILAVSFSAKADIQTFLNNAVIEIENPTSIQTYTHNVYFGGGFHLRTPRVNFQPFQVVAPSIKAGCGGIDITFGAFSYFNKEYLVDFVKKTVAQAPAIAFWTAIQTLCPQCQQLQSKLAQLANAINSMNFDSCSIAQSIGGAAGKWFGGTLNTALDVGTEGPDWLKSVNNAIGDATNFINNTFNNTMTSKGCEPSQRGCYLHFMKSNKTSLLAYALEDNTYFSSATGFQNILRALIGDIKKLGISDEQQLKYIYIAPTVEGSNVRNVLYGLMGLKSDCGTWTYDKATGEGGNTVSATTDTVCSYVKTNLDNIISKIHNRQPLSTSDIQFLNMFRIPVYKIFNTLSMQPEALDSVKKELLGMLSAELTYEILSSIFSDFNHIGGKLQNAAKDGYLPIDPENLEKIKKNQAELLRISHEMAVDQRKEFLEQIQDNFAIERLKAMLMASLARHPMMDSRLFAQSLMGFGL
ncbi:conjugal transfer protein TraH [Persephonella sp.]